MNIVDSLITLRILSLLTTPWEQTDAFKLGIIDKNGTPLKHSSTLKGSEKDVYTPLTRLVFKLKRMLEKIPGADKQLVAYAAAYALVKESKDYEKIEALSETTLSSMMDMIIVTEGIDKYIQRVKMYTEAGGLVGFSTFREEVAANNVAVTPGVDTTSKAVPLFKKPVTRKNKNKNDSGS